MPNRERILIVEDDRDTLAALFTVLLQGGYSPLTAENGQQAIDLLDRGLRPSCIVLDLMMSKVSGYALIDYLRADMELRTIPTLVITALAKEELAPLVVDGVFHKPLDYKALLASIDRCASRRGV
jgi:CheY-like chemotaxis protein